LSKLKYYNVNSPLFSDPNLNHQGTNQTEEDVIAYKTKNRH